MAGGLPEDGGQGYQARRPPESTQCSLGKLHDRPGLVIREDWHGYFLR